MPIPDLDEHGLLPPEIHDCTLEEIAERFGRDRWVENTMRPCRSRHFARLRDYLDAFRRLGLPALVLVNGSFATDKPEPGDVDLAVVLPADHDFARDLRPFEHNLLSKRRVRQEGYPFDLFVVAEGSSQYQEVVRLFHRVKDQPERSKGFLRVRP
jgi:predicted nucleotidyltransferase